LDAIDTIVDEFHKKYSLSNLISVIKENKSYNEKIAIIKERFPQYIYRGRKDD